MNTPQLSSMNNLGTLCLDHFFQVTRDPIQKKGGCQMILTAVILWLVAFVFLIMIVKNVISRATKKKRCTASTNAIIKEV